MVECEDQLETDLSAVACVKSIDLWLEISEEGYHVEYEEMRSNDA